MLNARATVRLRDFQNFRTVRRTAVQSIVRAFCHCGTVVCDCGMVVPLPISAKVAKNVKMKKGKTLNQPYPTFFFKSDKMLGLHPKKHLFKVLSLTIRRI